MTRGYSFTRGRQNKILSCLNHSGLRPCRIENPSIRIYLILKIVKYLGGLLMGDGDTTRSNLTNKRMRETICCIVYSYLSKHNAI